MEVYIVYCEYYQEKSIEKIFLNEEKAYDYAEEQNKKYNSQAGWWVDWGTVE